MAENFNPQFDPSGRDRMVKNVMCSWGGHFVIIIGGFIMPRVIDRYLGQSSLGIWDFSWSMVSYFSLAGIGVGSSVNRYVAMYRAEGEREKLRKAVCSVMAVQALIAFTVMALTVGAVLAVPSVFGVRVGARVSDAQWMVFLLGASLAIQMGFDAFRGIITGCHRWDLHNILNSACYAAAVIGILISLAMGGGLRSCAMAWLLAVLLTEIVRVAIAHRVCPELSLSLAYVKWHEAKKMIRFGGNSFISGLPPLVLGQSVNILLARSIGPAALALYSRPGGLLRNLQTFINKFAFVLTPTAGSLRDEKQRPELRKLTLQSARFVMFLTLPVVVGLSILGNAILKVWMGSNYADASTAMTVLTLGLLLPITQQPMLNILTGLNFHGWIGRMSFLIAIAGLVCGTVTLHFVGWTLTGAAFVVAVPMTVSSIVLIFYGCRKIGIDSGKYLRHAFVQPALCSAPFALAIAMLYIELKTRPLLLLGASALAGIFLIVPLYWRYVVPVQMRERCKEFLRGKFSGKQAPGPVVDEALPLAEAARAGREPAL